MIELHSQVCCTVSQQTGSTFAQLWLLCRHWLLSLRGAFRYTVAAAHSASIDASSIENGLFSTDCRKKQLDPAVSRPAAHARAAAVLCVVELTEYLSVMSLCMPYAV